MPIQARYAHTNLVALDWKRLVDFYIEVFGCQPVLPERHIAEPWLAAVTGIAGVRLDGMHLRLPGHGENGPTLEIFQYHPAAGQLPTAANRPGFAHLAFAVEDVAAALSAVQRAGGGMLGELVKVQVAGAGTITLVYATDPEGNILELQRWEH